MPPFLRLARTAPALLLAVALGAACADQDRDDEAQATAQADTTSPGAPPESAAVAANNASTPMEDPQIASIIAAADSTEIAISQLAVQKATSPQVRQFAEMMVRDHSGTRQQTQQLLTQMAVRPLPHPTGSQIEATAQGTMQALQGQTGAAFDREFMNYQVTNHETLLGALDNTLIPVASERMKPLLQTMRTAVAGHLEQARQVQQGLPQG